jgi:hypothetical protein
LSCPAEGSRLIETFHAPDNADSILTVRFYEGQCAIAAEATELFQSRRQAEAGMALSNVHLDGFY